MSDLIFPGWRNGNQNINYPFSDRATLVNSNDEHLSRDLFDDARIYPIGGAVGAFLSQVKLDNTSLTIFISDSHTANTATAQLELGAEDSELALFDQYGRPAGVLVSDTARLQELFSKFKQGSTLFSAAEAEFLPSVVVPMPQSGVLGVVLDDGTFIANDLYLCGTDGIVLRVEDGAIRIDIVGDPYAALVSCANNSTPLPSFCGVRTINNIAPDERGDYKLFQGANQAADNILRVIPTANGLRLIALGQKANNGRA